MSDLISRQAAIDVLNEYFGRIGKLKCRGLTKGEKAISLDVVGAIKTLPTIEAEPIKHGRWLIGVGENGEPIGTYCSECGWSWVNGVAAVNLNKALSLIKTPRCPWCGAKMDEVEE